MHKWRNTCPDVLLTRLEEIADTRFYLLRQTGPTGFLVKEHEGETKFKVLLGSSHSCDCSNFLKERELCMHILWILMKKFRVAKDNPIVYQLGLCERELNNVIYGKKQETSKPGKVASAGTNPNILKQKAVDKDDVCPICQDDIYKTKRTLIFCKFGCGNSVHISCMKIWADHQYKSTQEEIIKCPLCRTEFASYKSIVNEHRQAVMKNKMMKMQKKQQDNVCCHKCRSQIPAQQRIYRCCACFNMHLCSDCFSSGFHKEHSFEVKGENSKWIPAERRELLLSIGGLNFSPERRSTTTSFSRSPNAAGSLKKQHRLSRGRSSSHTDLRDVSLGISGLKLQRNDNSSVQHNPTNKPLLSSKFRLPPLPKTNRGLVTKSPSRRLDFSGNSPMVEDLVVFSSSIKSTPATG